MKAELEQPPQMMPVHYINYTKSSSNVRVRFIENSTLGKPVLDKFSILQVKLDMWMQQH